MTSSLRAFAETVSLRIYRPAYGLAFISVQDFLGSSVDNFQCLMRSGMTRLAKSIRELFKSESINVIRIDQLPYRSAIRKFYSFWRPRHVRALDLFDASWYLSHNSDVADKKINPFNHYRSYGWREGRWPNPIFDPLWYTQTHSDVAQQGIEPLEHFERHGRFEGRRPSAVFDQAAYLRLNPDVAASDIEPCEHYIRHGRSEGRATVEINKRRVAFPSAGADPTEFIPHLTDAIETMRNATAIMDRPFPEEAVAEAVLVLMRLDLARSDWRSRFLAKTIYQVNEDLRPVPDGLSYDYLELADTLNDGGLASGNLTYEERILLASADPVGAVEALLQRELGEAAKLQARGLQNRGLEQRE